MGTCLSAADLTLAAQLRPLRIVPFFAEHPQMQSLWVWQRALLARYAGEGDSAYESASAAARLQRAPWRRCLREAAVALPYQAGKGVAGNDRRTMATITGLRPSIEP